ncbi:MAG: DUF4411 family protein [Cenarchaeum sp. SB0661_bin_35]|nr:DUF4411 family protein [Cenarchaeum sp. SB0667_bin_13]MXY37919.1 DUF4411 family protein [Cenarchaeum sp. SB0664_bin_35]MXZ93533.1 DUF4411 family protein [Cenarchaeum sp. SB0666_bin_15]MYB46601.1 DUF4411 family protein [Cenarchaeum sp. SB0662_bin_33]MYC79877.1 DUF4411 family protein [Cenarchaeum sp. SB0661_bin_35]MYD58766.1 DUF4411 family protein [Cenarchaeum sp. SB0678_bin_8]MYI51746.1 DUF4411 family protein [Cenarchaeum sp. SB0673_bin_9]MYJ27218.1 DUF4411 family protein [Cenarchaeum sp. 
MGLVDYWLDSNVFIEGEKWGGPYWLYPVPRFWISLNHMSDVGLLACPSMIYAELQDSRDGQPSWARERKKAGMFMDPDVTVQQEFQNICAYMIECYADNQYRRRFLDRAEPWVIAHALGQGGMVVTHKPREPKTVSRVKIQDVCAHFGVRCIDVEQMFQYHGLSYT